MCLTVAADRGRDVVLAGDCSCPFGQEGNFCKHCVATGLAALKLAKRRQAIPASHQKRDLLVSWLASLSKDELVAEILGLLDSDRDLRRRLELRAAARRANVDQVRGAVQNLVEADGFIEYAEARDYARNVSRAAEAIDALIDGGVAEDAIYLARDALDWVTEAYGSADDSSGSIGTAAHELLSAHLRACQAAPPDPVDLGEYLAELIIGDNYDLAPDPQDYADLLGEAGTTAIREYVAAVYEAKPELWNARNLMGSLLKAEGDVDALVAFYSAHLDDRGQQHLTIARALDEADRQDDALDWAERGVRGAARPETTGSSTTWWPGTPPQAVKATSWNCAARSSWLNVPSPTTVHCVRPPRTQELGWWNGPRHSPSSPRTQRAITPLTEQTGDKVYDQMARLLLSARDCHEALGSPGEFRRYLAVLRTSQKRKRNLMKILADNGL